MLGPDKIGWEGHTIYTGTARALRNALLAASTLTAAPVLAQEQSVDARFDRLEWLVEGLITRLDADQGEARQQAEALAAIRTETGAIRAAHPAGADKL